MKTQVTRSSKDGALIQIVENNQDLKTAEGLIAGLEGLQNGSRTVARDHERQKTDYVVSATKAALSSTPQMAFANKTSYKINMR